MEKKKNTTFKFSEAERGRIRELAQAEGKSQAQVLTDALDARERERERERAPTVVDVEAEIDYDYRPRAEFFPLIESMTAHCPEPRWAVPGIFPEGICCLSAEPKVGTSHFALGVAAAVVRGGYMLGRKCEQGEVLYCDLEQNRGFQQQRRFRKHGLGASPGRQEMATGFHIVSELPTFDDPSSPGGGALEELAQIFHEKPKIRLCVIDVWATVAMRDAPPKSSGRTEYMNSYPRLRVIRTFFENHHVCCLLVHHDMAGDFSFSAACNVVASLSRSEESPTVGTLKIIGRDVAQGYLNLRFRDERWTIANAL